MQSSANRLRTVVICQLEVDKVQWFREAFYGKLSGAFYVSIKIKIIHTDENRKLK